MSHADQVEVALPRGVLDGDQRHRTLMLRPLAGREEELLAGLPAGVSAAERVTVLLARCLERVGMVAPDVDDVRRLTTGDREALLLHLRRVTVGDRIDCVVSCPHEGCGEPVDVELSAGGLLLPPYDEVVEWREETFRDGDRPVPVRFRLPTGADQEAVAELARRDAPSAARRLLARCIEPARDGGDPVAALGEEGMAALSARMADLDPQAELRLRMDCPACGSEIETLFDTAAFLFAEMAAAGHRLYEEVHALAWYYHWSEGDILDLTAGRRRRYLDLIAASLERPTERGVA